MSNDRNEDNEVGSKLPQPSNDKSRPGESGVTDVHGATEGDSLALGERRDDVAGTCTDDSRWTLAVVEKLEGSETANAEATGVLFRAISLSMAMK